jgi:L-threonylcarbamoyladenylate synthase
MTTKDAAQKILEGELVVFPTETVYGLGALASNQKAVKRIFEVKGRPQHNPLIIHVSKDFQIRSLVQKIPEKAKLLMTHFWPGPLTLCLKKSPQVSDFVTAGLPTVCIRCPDHQIAAEFLRNVEAPVAAPSANLSGCPSTTRIEDAKMQLETKGVFFLEGGTTPLGIESTVLDVSKEPFSILRSGIISKQSIEKVIQCSVADATKGEHITSPGQMLEHYAPEGTLTVVIGNLQQRRQWIKKQKNYCESTIGFIGSFSGLKAAHLYELNVKETDLETFSARLYVFLNWCNRLKSAFIFVEFPSQSSSLSEALLDRLKKASRGNMVFV